MSDCGMWGADVLVPNLALARAVHLFHLYLMTILVPHLQKLNKKVGSYGLSCFCKIAEKLMCCASSNACQRPSIHSSSKSRSTC